MSLAESGAMVGGGGYPCLMSRRGLGPGDPMSDIQGGVGAGGAPIQ